MLKLRLQVKDDKGNLIGQRNCGQFRSYKDIGKYLHSKGKVGEYYVLPSNMSSIAAMKQITVSKDKYGKQVIMDGSVY